jgi:integrase
MRFTVKSITGVKLPPGKSDHIEFDEEIPGFGLRLRKGGSRALVFQYELGQKQRRMSLGRLNAVNFDDIKEEARRLYAKVKLGQDPAAEKVEAKSKAHGTFGAAVTKYLEWQKTKPRKNGTIGLKPRSVLELERHLLEFGKPLHKLRLEKISRTDIANCLGSIEKKSGPVAKNRARSSLSGLFTWARMEGKVEANPVAFTRKSSETNRDRVLTKEELHAIWNALPDDQYGDIVRLLALTGQRRDEIACLRWSEIAGTAIVLPLERTKNGREHLVPLAPLAQDIIGRQLRRTNPDGTPRDLIFGFGDGGFSGWSTCKERLDKKIANAQGGSLARWRLHDLRRTVATGMAGIGVQPHIIEAVLNNASGYKSSVARIYNRSIYEKEKREALADWAIHIEEVTSAPVKSKSVSVKAMPLKGADQGKRASFAERGAWLARATK